MIKRFVSVTFAAFMMHAAIAPAGALPEPPAKRGCCSHHDGVCGCSGGRVTCCDGVTSPSCTC
jgi:hypothetical protein